MSIVVVRSFTFGDLIDIILNSKKPRLPLPLRFTCKGKKYIIEKNGEVFVLMTEGGKRILSAKRLKRLLVRSLVYFFSRRG